uniref:Reverse transcriptase domain-containing protein n=1 Tax=Tanacetum cinerariifolium TaxID=118510 RepID=A0A6L2P8Q3_TANCI|nr:hypothetical protein [Tanacetum cinerariifolium]
MSEASSAVTYTSVYTDFEPGRVFWEADEELLDGGSLRVIVYGYDGLPMMPVAPPGSPVDYPMDEGKDGDDEGDGDSSGYDADEDEEEEEKEHLAPADSAMVISIDELVAPPEETKPTIPPPSTDTTTIGARITIQPQTSISLPPKAEVERLLAMPTPSPSPLTSLSPHTSLSPPSARERLARCMAPAALPSPPLPPFSYPPPPVDRRDGILKSEQPPHKRLCLASLGSRYEVGESFTRGREVEYGFADTVKAEMRHRGIREVGYRIRDTWIDPVETVHEIASTTLEKVNTRVTKLFELHEHDTQDLYALLEDAQDNKDGRTPRDLPFSTVTDSRDSPSDERHETRDGRHAGQAVSTTWIAKESRTARRTNHGTSNKTMTESTTSQHQQTTLSHDSRIRNEGVVGLTRWIEKMESVFNISGCAIENQVKFATCTLLDAALTWWNGQIRTLGPEAYAMTWEFIANENEKIDKYISGLPDNIYGNVKSSKPRTLDETIELTNELMDQKLRTYAERGDNKRKTDDTSKNNHGHQQQPFKKQNVAKVYNMGMRERKPYEGSLPKSSGNANVANAQRDGKQTPRGNGCFECGASGHFKRDYPKLRNKNGGNRNAQGWVYAVGNAEKNGNAPTNPDLNVVTGTFLLNNRYASILFDTGADRSFISIAFSSLVNIDPTPLGSSYDVELADGKIVGIDTIIRGCTINFLNHPFKIDLMPVALGSFDVIIVMDWLRRRHAVIVFISCSKAQRYMAKGCQTFMAQLSAKKEEDKSEGKQLKDVPIVWNFLKVFPEDLPGLPPARNIDIHMLEASSSVTYTSVYTDSESGRVFLGADEELSDEGSPRVIVYEYDGFPMMPVALPSPDYIPGPKKPHTPPAPQDENEHELMFIQPHDPDIVPEPIFPEYIPLEDEHILLAEEQPLPLDETEDGPVSYPIDGRNDEDNDGIDSSGYDADNEDEEEEEYLALADSATVIPIDELASPPEGTKSIIPPPPLTPLPLELGLLSDHRLPYPFHQRQKCMAPAALPSPPLPPSSYPPPPVDRRDGIPESEQPPRKRLCLATLGSRYEVGESSTRGRGVDYGFANTVEAEMRHRGIREVGYGIRDTWIDPTEEVPEIASTTLEKDGRTRISQRVAMDSQRVDLLMGDRMTLQETVWIMEKEAYAARED